jgi:2-methylcitrate dehydratase PrpD
MRDEQATARAGLQTLTQWATSTTADAIPSEVMARAATILADDLGAIVAASGEPEVSAFQAMVLDRPAAREATVFRGGRPRTDRYSAALANGLAACWLELDEGYRKASCHAGLYIVPALLAEAEAADLPVREVLRALVLAYEIVTRCALTWNATGGHVHAHAQYAATGAAAAVALTRGLSGDGLANVLNMASTLATAGPRTHVVVGALVRNTWPAVGAWSGMMSVDWAQCGLNGSPDGLSDVFGTIFQAPTDAQHLTAGLGQFWAVQDGYTKLYACCQFTHSVAEAALGVLQQLGRSAIDRIGSIEVETHPLAINLNNANPETTLAAKFSVPHVVAATLASGSAGADSFRSESMQAPDIARLRPLVSMRLMQPALEPPHDRASRVSVRLQDGRTLSSECLSAIGSPDRPLDWAMLQQKLLDNTGARYSHAAEVLQEWMRQEPVRRTETFRHFLDTVCAE